MTDYDITQWSDFVRGVVDPTTEQRMTATLETSARAQKKVTALRRVMELAEAEAEAPLPEWAVRCAKAIGSLRRPQESRAPSLLDRLAMALTFDSAVSPAFAGTRDLQADRQLVFESGGYSVDLRLEPEADEHRALLVGQLVHQGDADVEPVANIPVLAMTGRGREMLARVHTSPFGEFQVEGLPTDDLELFFLLDDDQCLEVQLGSRHEAEIAGGPA